MGRQSIIMKVNATQVDAYRKMTQERGISPVKPVSLWVGMPAQFGRNPDMQALEIAKAADYASDGFDSEDAPMLYSAHFVAPASEGALDFGSVAVSYGDDSAAVAPIIADEDCHTLEKVVTVELSGEEYEKRAKNGDALADYAIRKIRSALGEASKGLCSVEWVNGIERNWFPDLPNWEFERRISAKATEGKMQTRYFVHCDHRETARSIAQNDKGFRTIAEARAKAEEILTDDPSIPSLSVRGRQVRVGDDAGEDLVVLENSYSRIFTQAKIVVRTPKPNAKPSTWAVYAVTRD